MSENNAANDDEDDDVDNGREENQITLRTAAATETTCTTTKLKCLKCSRPARKGTCDVYCDLLNEERKRLSSIMSISTRHATSSILLTNVGLLDHQFFCGCNIQ